MQIQRVIKLANASQSEMVVQWSVYESDILENVERPLIQFSLGEGDEGFGFAALEPETREYPLSVFPQCAPIPKRGASTFYGIPAYFEEGEIPL